MKLKLLLLLFTLLVCPVQAQILQITIDGTLQSNNCVGFDSSVQNGTPVELVFSIPVANGANPISLTPDEGDYAFSSSSLTVGDYILTSSSGEISVIPTGNVEFNATYSTSGNPFGGSSHVNLITSVPTSGFSSLESITPSGNLLGSITLIGAGSFPQLQANVSSFSTEVVPEPSTYLLFALGLLGIGLKMRKRAS
jgi:PEP-CTERM motif